MLASGKYCRFQQHIDRGISEGVLTSREPVQQGSLYFECELCVPRHEKSSRGFLFGSEVLQRPLFAVQWALQRFAQLPLR